MPDPQAGSEDSKAPRPDDASAAPAPQQESKAQPENKTQQEKDQEIGDFITRHVLEKDSVFFEG